MFWNHRKSYILHLDSPNILGYKRNTEIKHINIMQDKAWRSYITLFLNCSLRNLFCHITNSKTKSYCLHLDSRQILWFREMRASWWCQMRVTYAVYIIPLCSNLSNLNGRCQITHGVNCNNTRIINICLKNEHKRTTVLLAAAQHTITP